jgi:hypothetical protein
MTAVLIIGRWEPFVRSGSGCVGGRPSSVVGSFDFNRMTIYGRITAASKPGVGLKALHSRPATERRHSLTPRHEQQVLSSINSHDPRQYGLDFWRLGNLLAKLGLTPQKLLQKVASGGWARKLGEYVCNRGLFG